MVCCWNRHHCIVLNRLLSTNKSLDVFSGHFWDYVQSTQISPGAAGRNQMVKLMIVKVAETTCQGWTYIQKSFSKNNSCNSCRPKFGLICLACNWVEKNTTCPLYRLYCNSLRQLQMGWISLLIFLRGEKGEASDLMPQKFAVNCAT